MSPASCQQIPAFNPDGKLINVIVETPRGCRNKFKFDPEHGVFTLCSVLPAGASFPYDFGFVPSATAPDGDPLDVLLLMDQPAFTGCLVESRVIGVLEAEQIEDGDEMVRNDRIVAVAAEVRDYADLQSFKDVNENLLEEIEHFFSSYNRFRQGVSHSGPSRS